MNGAVMKNFVSPSSPFASALVGDPELFVSEVDESDGSIALYRPTVAVLGNISLDHKEMDELRDLFSGFLASATKAVVNLDDPESRILADALPDDRLIGYGFDSPAAALIGRNLELLPDGVRFDAELGGEKHVGKRSWLIHHSMTALEEGLDPELFVRLHRSAIVRRDFIAGFSRNASGRWIARLADGNEQPVGRLYADQVRAIAGR